MDEPNYFCHECRRAISLVEIESIKCPICNGGCVEEIGTATADHHQETTDSDDALSLWTPILLGMMSNPRRRRRLRRFDLDDDEMYRDAVGDDNHRYHGGDGDSELDRELEAIMRRRRSSAAILHLLQGLRAGIRGGHEQMQGSALAGLIAESENAERELGGSDNHDNNNREHVILMNPFNQSIIIQGSYNSNNNNTDSQHPIGSLGDYFIGPGLEMLIQHLAENDPNRYGTPPAQKDAVESLPNVIIQDSFQCSVCLEDFEIGSQAKEMPCKHRFHDGCILPWLELHSSCPVCRHQLPCDESKVDNNSNGNPGETSNGEEGGERNGSARRSTVTLPWPFSSLFSSSSSSTSAPGSGSHSDEN